MGKVRKSRISPDGLTFKQRKFADKYLETGNGTQAVLATYDANPETARTFASENLSKPLVEGYIVSKLTHKDLTPQLILDKLLLELQSLHPAARLKSLELLGKHLKMFGDKLDATNQLDQVKSIGWASSCSASSCECSCHGMKEQK